MIIKTRFAPSPTGDLHIGSIRTALYAWLFARSKGGKFILRIEDTDSERSTESSIQIILESMAWLNLDWDEGPYFQSKRIGYYNTVINNMLLQGTCYKCYCSKKRLDDLRKKQIMNGDKPRYDGLCYNKSKHDHNNEPHVVRFRNPQSGSVTFTDLIRGDIKFDNYELDDLIIRRTDGIPTYNFCVVMDDYDMNITHVIRGEEHINNTPRQINILKSLDAPIPKYAHVPMIFGNDGKKLSKRHGARSVMQYYHDGFLPEALLNYLVRLGWSHGDREIFSINELKTLFNLDKINKSACIFDLEKLLWFNRHYINNLPKEYVIKNLTSHIKQKNIDYSLGPDLLTIAQLFQTRCKTLKELSDNCCLFYQSSISLDSDVSKKYLTPMALKPLTYIYNKLQSLDDWSVSAIHAVIMKTKETLGLKMDKIGMPLRVALIGTDHSPAINDIMYILGRSKCLERIKSALSFIKNTENLTN